MLAMHDHSIEEISQSIFTTMLSVDLVRIEAPMADMTPSLQAAIHIAGGWTGCVVISLSKSLKQIAAAALFGASPSEMSDDDEKETATELANMIGGNLKSLLPGPSYLSLPSIVEGEDPGLRASDSELLDDVWLMSEYGPFRVRLFHKKESENN